MQAVGGDGQADGFPPPENGTGQHAEGRQLPAYLWTENLGRLASALAATLGRTRSGVCWAARRDAERATADTPEIERWCR